MKCLEARKCIFSYLNESIGDMELSEFMEHIDECPECFEELKITHMVYSGVKKLDSDDDDSSFDIDAVFKRNLERSRRHLLLIGIIKILRMVMDTLVFWLVLFAALTGVFRIFF